jgi:hypothetical protein
VRRLCLLVVEHLARAAGSANGRVFWQVATAREARRERVESGTCPPFLPSLVVQTRPVTGSRTAKESDSS